MAAGEVRDRDAETELIKVHIRKGDVGEEDGPSKLNMAATVEGFLEEK